MISPKNNHLASGIIHVFTLLLLMYNLSGCRSSTVEESENGDLWVAEGFTAELVAGPDLVNFPMFARMDMEGRLFVSESTEPNTMTTDEMLEHPTFQISILEDVDGDGFFDKSHVFADSLAMPQGLVFFQGSLYVSAAPDLFRLTDTTGDGVADKREVILTGWGPSVNACTLQGPYFGPDGWLYMPDCRRAHSIETKEGKLMEGGSAMVWRSRPDGTGLEWVSGGGFANAVGLTFMPTGEMIGTGTWFMDPQLGQRDALVHWVEGGLYPTHKPSIDEDELIYTGDLMPLMTQLPNVAPAGIHRYRSNQFGDDFKDNLFTAHYNTGRIVRSVIIRDGGTFRTENEDFFTSKAPRFHTTDVLEDADGSLLVLDTGGWFVRGCPISGPAQMDALGGIYRIKKKDHPAVKDPRGENLNLESLSPAQLISHLGDTRTAVQDRATELLVEAGPSSVQPLTELINDENSGAELRLSAVFISFRIGTPEALSAVRLALSDNDFRIRIAAARSAGMARDKQAVDRLMEMVISDETPVQRQAATALGQIGDERAAVALLSAASNVNDRFAEHSVIYSLTILGNSQHVIQALTHESPNVRKSALIALDQMKGDHLTGEQLISFLENENEDLRQTALWIASRHPEWSDEILDFLESQLTDSKMTENQIESAADVLVSFCSDDDVQILLGRMLAGPDTSVQRKIFLMDTIERCEADLIVSLVRQIGSQLNTSDNDDVRSHAVDLIRSREISELLPHLETIANNTGEHDVLRISAIDALVSSRPQLSVSLFNYLLDKMEPDQEPSLRQSASRALGRSELDEAQLLKLANEYVPRMEPFIVTKFIETFKHSGQSMVVGNALIENLQSSAETLDYFAERDLNELFSGFPEDVQVSAQPLLKQVRLRDETRLQRVKELASTLSGGDALKGRTLFFSNKALCSTCHAVEGEGANFGPDLTNIGEIRSRIHILEKLLYPNVNLARGYETQRIETNGSVYIGIIKDETPGNLVVDVAPQNRIRIAKDEIISMEPFSNSLMPTGLSDRLSAEELADLMAYLEALPYRWEDQFDKKWMEQYRAL